MEGLIERAPMTDLVRVRGFFDRHPFVLIDVGCSGGIDRAWRHFGPSLVVHGFDPNVAACESARAAETFPNVHYHPRFVGLPESHPFARRCRDEAERWPWVDPSDRLVSWHLATKRAREAGAPPAPPRWADPSTLIGVDEIVREQRLEGLDFLKVDVDGKDLEVLESARGVLASRQVLGVGVEVNWFGTASPTEHTFANTDRLLKGLGFTLFGLSVRRYSRRALPAPFEWNDFSQGRYGQPFQGTRSTCAT